MQSANPFAQRLQSVCAFLGRLARPATTGARPVETLILVCQDGIGWEDIYYLTGFLGSSSVLLIAADDAQLFVDARYVALAHATCCCKTVSCAEVRRSSPLQAALGSLAEHRPKCVGYGGRRFSHAAWRYLERMLGTEAELVDLSNLLSNMRRRKDPAEIASIRTAAGIAARAFRGAVEAASAGMTERAFAACLTHLIQTEGGDFTDPVPIMVASGERTALPHALPTDRAFVRGDLVMVDFGARYGGYVCDITRMLSVGEPTDELRSLHAIVGWAQVEAASAIAPGRRAQEVDAAARSVLESAQLGAYFVHGVGHGIGLSVHESPGLGLSSEASLAEGDVVTLEPGFYRPGWGGMRIEDDYLVTASGSVCLTEEIENELYVIRAEAS